MAWCCCSSVSSVDEAGRARSLLVVLLLSVMALGFVMILDSPGSVEKVLQSEMKIKPSQFELHYYLLYWPNILSCVFGFLMDRCLDLRLVTGIFITVSVIGNTLYTMGAVTRVYLVMLIGWLITGVGIECCVFCIHCYILRWFPTRMTNTVFALVKSLPLLGTILVCRLSDTLLEGLYNVLRPQPAFSIMVSLEMSIILVPLACAIALALMSKIKRSISSRQNYLSLSHIWKFPTRFWLLTITANIFYSSCIIFLRLNDMKRKYRLDESQMDMLVSSFIIGACLMSPVLGLVVDCKGRNLTCITLAFVTACISHFSFAFTVTHPFFPLILLSFSFSLFISSYWPLISYVCEKRELNAALAIDNSVLMLFCAIGQGVAPKLIKYNKNAVEIYYLTSMILAVIGSCILWGVDCKENGFNLSSRKRMKNNKQMPSRKETGIVTRNRHFMVAPTRHLLKVKINQEPPKPKKLEHQSTYLRLKKFEVESNLYKHQRIKRQAFRMMDRKKSKSSEELYFLSSQV